MSATVSAARVLARIVRALGLAVAAHVPADDPPAVAERGALAVPHAPGRRVAVPQQHRGPAPAVLILDLDPVQPGFHRITSEMGLTARVL